MRVSTLDDENYTYSNLLIWQQDEEENEIIIHYSPTTQWQDAHDNGEFLPYDGLLEVTDTEGNYLSNQNAQGKGAIIECNYTIEPVWTCSNGNPHAPGAPGCVAESHSVTWVLVGGCTSVPTGGGGNNNGGGIDPDLPTDPTGGPWGGGSNNSSGGTAFDIEFLGALTQNQINWLNANPNVIPQIYNYLQAHGQPDNQNGWYGNYQAVQFALWAVEYLMNNPDLSTNNIIEHLQWLEHVYDGELQNNPCAAVVYNKLKNNKTAFNMLKNFEGDAPIMHLEWKVENLGNCNSSSCQSGQTTSNPYNALITIELNSNMLYSASKVWVASIMLHELIHAHIYRKVYTEEDNNPYYPNPHDFPSLWEAYITNSDYSHEYMATHYVNIIKNALQSYCQSENISVSNEILTALAWGGLQDTTPWNNLPLSTRLQYNTIQGQQIVAGGCP
ncbi:MAG: hypothetical protein WCY25_02515 [Moheibacter sp.]